LHTAVAFCLEKFLLNGRNLQFSLFTEISELKKMNTNNIIYKALLLAKAGDWQESHNIAQSNEGHPDYDRLHALLHRIEGDEWNAKYWYRRCKVEFPIISTEEEIEDLIELYS
jgi:hypothetical protein